MGIPEEIADRLSKKMEKVANGHIDEYREKLDYCFDKAIQKQIESILGIDNWKGITQQSYLDQIREVVQVKISEEMEKFKNEFKVEDFLYDIKRVYKQELESLIRQAACKKAEEDFNNFIGAKK